jgi:hypothetical protein
MTLGERIKDSFYIGMLSGLITFILSFFMITYIRSLVVNYYSNPYILLPPSVQLLSMGINVILFRILIINLKRENTGKGFLFVTVLITLVYFFIFFKAHK